MKPPAERILWLDALRGAAVLAIIPLNARWLLHPADAYHDPSPAGTARRAGLALVGSARAALRPLDAVRARRRLRDLALGRPGGRRRPRLDPAAPGAAVPARRASASPTGRWSGRETSSSPTR